MPPITVIYHRSDYDGKFCREIARKQLGDVAEYIGWDYGDPEPVVDPEQTLYILDLSVPGLMGHKDLIWIDHHKTAIEKYSISIPGYRIDGVAACRLAWQWFYLFGGTSPLPQKQAYLDRLVHEPLAVRLAGEYDIWDKRDPRAEVFQFGLRVRELERKDWDGLLACTVLGDDCALRLLGEGRIAQAYQRRVDRTLMESRGFELTWEALRFLAVNTGRFNSLTFDSAVKPEHDALLGFSWDGKKWVVSLYGVPHKPNLDLSAIAKKYGGGGHRQACGFTCEKLPFPIS